jgi:hypothetical protein
VSEAGAASDTEGSSTAAVTLEELSVGCEDVSAADELCSEDPDVHVPVASVVVAVWDVDVEEVDVDEVEEVDVEGVETEEVESVACVPVDAVDVVVVEVVPPFDELSPVVLSPVDGEVVAGVVPPSGCVAGGSSRSVTGE